MKIHFSSATIQSYENKEKTMDLFYSPIVIFEDTDFNTVQSLDDVAFVINSDKIGTYMFDIQQINKASIEEKENRVFIEFRLSKKDVPFEYDNYDCSITFKATLEEQSLEHTVLGIVKTKWTKGLV